MKISRQIFLLLSFLTLFSALAKGDAENDGSPLLKVYYLSEGKHRVEKYKVEEVENIDFNLEPAGLSETPYENTGVNALNINLSDGTGIKWGLDSVESLALGTSIPKLYITTDPEVEEVPNRETYLTSSFRYLPFDSPDSVCADVLIRGRGNSTWKLPKKSYRLKFDKKQEIGNLKKAKSYVLIANYLDKTLMKNAVAYKIAELIGLPYTNVPQPVDLIFNGKNRGSYLLTNKVGINAGSVDIDEKEGILWEIDANYDEDYRFKSPTYKLPCNLKDPDLTEITESDTETRELWRFWKNDLDLAFQKVEAGKWTEAFDSKHFVDYILVSAITQNTELQYPKSLFIYKKDKNDTYHLGPVWDYDWAFGYDAPVERNILTESSDSYPFFIKVFADSEFRKMFEAALTDFRENHLQELMDFIDDYAFKIRDSAIENSFLWTDEPYLPYKEITSTNFMENVEELKAWIKARIEYIATHPNYSLY